MISGVKARALRKIPDERGYPDGDDAVGLGRVRALWPGVRHRRVSGRGQGLALPPIQTDHFICLHGMAKVVLYDGRPDSPTHGVINEFFMGDQNPMLLKIPPLVMHGFKGISPEMTLIINVPTELFQLQRARRVPPALGHARDPLRLGTQERLAPENPEFPEAQLHAQCRRLPPAG